MIQVGPGLRLEAGGNALECAGNRRIGCRHSLGMCRNGAVEWVDKAGNRRIGHGQEWALVGNVQNRVAEWVDTGGTRLAAGSRWEWAGMGWKRVDWAQAGMGARASALS